MGNIYKNRKCHECGKPCPGRNTAMQGGDGNWSCMECIDKDAKEMWAMLTRNLNEAPKVSG